MKWANGKTYYGDWINGLFEGKGISKFENGDFYDGEYINNKKNGKGIYYLNDKTSLSANFVNNKIHGKGEISNRNIKLNGIWSFGRNKSITNNGNL